MYIVVKERVHVEYLGTCSWDHCILLCTVHRHIGAVQQKSAGIAAEPERSLEWGTESEADGIAVGVGNAAVVAGELVGPAVEQEGGPQMLENHFYRQYMLPFFFVHCNSLNAFIKQVKRDLNIALF